MATMSKSEMMRKLGGRGEPDLFLCGGGYFTGVPAGARFLYAQDTPSSVWTVPHNLGCKPAVTVIDQTGSQVYADVQYVSDDIVRVTHGRPQAGLVSCA